MRSLRNWLDRRRARRALRAHGTGPLNGQVVTNFIKVYVGAGVRWVPVMT